jgi:nucleoside-diphosphate-sugar epimerase
VSRVLVTGATGFIGGAVARALAGRGDDVRALVRDPARLSADGAEPVRGDLADAGSLAVAAEDVDAVVHCAGVVSDWLPAEEIRRVNVEGTGRVLDACRTAGVRRLVHLSSLAVLGSRHHRGTDESAPYAPSDAYGAAKIESERLVLASGGVEAVVLRPGFVYGPGDNQFLPRLLDSLAQGRFAYVGDGSKLLNVVDVGDIAAAALLALDTPAAAGQAYNLTDGTQTSLRTFVEAVADEAGYQRPARSIPPPVAFLAAYVLEALARARRSREAPRLNRGRLKFLHYEQHFSIEKARRELGYAPATTYREGVPRAVAWFRDTGRLPAVA